MYYLINKYIGNVTKLTNTNIEDTINIIGDITTNVATIRIPIINFNSKLKYLFNIFDLVFTLLKESNTTIALEISLLISIHNLSILLNIAIL
jgi:hypothetical protein